MFRSAFFRTGGYRPKPKSVRFVSVQRYRVNKRILFVGAAARQIARMYQACIPANGKAVVIFNPRPDKNEVAEAFGQMFLKESYCVIDGGKTEAVVEALEHNSQNVLIINADSLSGHAQMEMQKKDRLHGWVLLTSKKPEDLANRGVPWGISFVRNAIGTSFAWRNLNERPQKEVISQIAATLEKMGIEVPEGLLEDRMAQLSREQIANALEVHAMAQTMAKSVRQGRRNKLEAVDVFAGMLFKDNSTASPASAAAGIVKGMQPLIDEDDDDGNDHIRPRTAARISRFDGGSLDRRHRGENPKYVVN